MNFATTIEEALHNLAAFMVEHGAGLPEWTRARVVRAMAAPSPVSTIVQAGEALYGAKANLTKAGRDCCGILMEFATVNLWHGLAIDNRGGRIVQAMQRAGGYSAPVGTEWPDAETDPSPLPEMVAP